MRTLILFSQILLMSCRFYSMAGSIPPHIKSISIPIVNNQTAEYGLSENLTDGIIEQFNEAGILYVVNGAQAHSILKGNIKKIDEGPYTYNKEESVSEFRYKIEVEIQWYDVENNKNIFDNVYTGFGAYGLSGEISSDGIDNDNDGKIDDEDDDEFGDPRSFATNVAVRKIAEDILNDIMTTW